MRIISGAWRGKVLAAPAGATTRPTADRVRQALFDMLWHAEWAGREAIEGAQVLDVFAGSGALGLEALSRGASFVEFLENDGAALAALRANIAACHATERCRITAGDACRPPRGQAGKLIFLDPPYGKGLVPRAVAALHGAGRIAADTLLVAEIGRDEASPEIGDILAERAHGAARLVIARPPAL